MKVINFKLKGRFAHFLRAEASASALSYPVPPRTVMLGIIGAVLGLPKDEPQVKLEPAYIAISGKLPITHWHRAKLRKDPPTLLPYAIKKMQKSITRTSPEKATLILQEWLFNPVYTVWISIPNPYLLQLKERLKEKRWYFTPSLGLSEMMADIEYLGSPECSSLPEGVHDVQSVFQQGEGNLNMKQALSRELSIHLLLLQMPRTVTQDRIFSHCRYILERESNLIPVKTNQAYKVGDKIIMFL